MECTRRLKRIVRITTVVMRYAIQSISAGCGVAHGHGEVADASQRHAHRHHHQATNGAGAGVGVVRLPHGHQEGVEKAVLHIGSSTDGHKVRGEVMDGVQTSRLHLQQRPQ